MLPYFCSTCDTPQTSEIISQRLYDDLMLTYDLIGEKPQFSPAEP